MIEQHYIIDCIGYDNQHSEYLTECEETDTRLAKVYAGDGQYWVVRPPSLEENRRLEYPKESYFEIKDEFGILLDELSVFDIKIPPYQMILSDYHTTEGQNGRGLCIVSEYIHGKCLPLENCNGLWDTNKNLYYQNMEKWLDSISAHMSSKYLAKEESKHFLTDIARPIQFVYSFDDAHLYLVDLDPLYSNILDKDGYLNERFLICLTTLNSSRNRYFNKGYKEGYINKKWGEHCRRNIQNLLYKTDILKKVKPLSRSEVILKNLIKSIEYKGVDSK